MSTGISLTSTNVGYTKAGSRQTAHNFSGTLTTGTHDFITVSADKTFYVLGIYLANDGIAAGATAAIGKSLGAGVGNPFALIKTFGTDYDDVLVTGNGYIATFSAGQTIRLLTTSGSLNYVVWGWEE